MANAKKLWEKGQTKQKTTPAASSGPAAAAVNNIVKNTQSTAAGQQRVSQSAVDQMLADVQKSRYATVSEVIRAGQKPVTARPVQQNKIIAGRESTTPLQKQTGSASIKDRLSRMAQVSRIGKDSTANKPLPTMTAGGALAGITTQVRPAASDTVRKLNSLAADIRSNENDLINMNRRLSALKAKANRGDASAVDSYNQLADRYNQKFDAYVANIGIYNTLYQGEYRDSAVRQNYAQREYQEYRRQNRDAGVRQEYRRRQLEEELQAPVEITQRRKGGSVGAHSQRRISGETPADAGFTYTHTPTRGQQAVRGAVNTYGAGMAATAGIAVRNLFAEDGGRGRSAGETWNTGEGTEVEAAARVWNRAKSGARDWADGLIDTGRDLNERGEIRIDLAKRGLGEVGQAVVDLGVIGVQMAADMGIGLLTGGSMLPALFTRSMGSAYLDKEGEYGQDAAELYGLGIGAVEALSEKMFSVFSIATRFAKGAVTQEMSGRIIDGLVKRMASSPGGRTALNRLFTILFSAGSEGLEEVAAGIMEPLIRKITLDHDVKAWQEIDWESALYEGLLGGILGGLGGAVDLTNTRPTYWKYYKEGIDESIGRYEAAVKKYGLESKEALQAAKAVWDGGTRKMNAVAGTIDVRPVTYHQLAAMEEARAYGRTDGVQGPTLADSLNPESLGRYLDQQEAARQQERDVDAYGVKSDEFPGSANGTSPSSPQGELTETSRDSTHDDGIVRLDTARSAQTRAQASQDVVTSGVKSGEFEAQPQTSQGVADLNGIPESELTQEEKDELAYGSGAVEDLGQYTGLAQRMGAPLARAGQGGEFSAAQKTSQAPTGGTAANVARTGNVDITRQMNNLAGRLQSKGLRSVEYVKADPRMNGMRVGNIIFINDRLTGEAAGAAAMGHEVVHFAGDFDAQLINDLIAAMRRQGRDIDGLVETKREIYRKQFAEMGQAWDEEQMNQAYFEEEVAADFIGEICRADSETLDRIAAEEPGLIRRIINALRNMLARITGNQQAVYEQAIDRLNAALEKAGRNENAVRTDDGVRYALTDVKVPTREELDAKPDMPVIDLRPYQEPQGSLKQQRKYIMEYAERSGLFSTPHFNADTDVGIFITPSTLSHVFSNLGIENITAAEHMPELIRSAVLTHAEKSRKQGDNSTGVYTFFAAGSNGTGVLPIKLKVKEYRVVGQDIPDTIKAFFEKNGTEDTYARLYDNRVLLLDGLEKEEASSSAASSRLEEPIADNYPSASSFISVKELLDLVKGDAAKYVPGYRQDSTEGQPQPADRPTPEPDVQSALQKLTDQMTKLTDMLSERTGEAAVAGPAFEQGENQGAASKSYKEYITPEAQARYAADPRFAKWKYKNLAYISAAAWDGVKIPYEVLAEIPELREARERARRESTSLQEKPWGSEPEVDARRDDLMWRLLDDEHGSAVFEDGKIRKVNDEEDFSGPVARERKAFIIIGRPAGGKSSVFANPLSNRHQARIIDSDTVKPWLDGYDDGYGAGYVQDESAEIMERALDAAIVRGENIIIPKIGGKSCIKMAEDLKAEGYTVELYYNDVAEGSSLMRAASRFAEKGRYLDLSYLTSIKDKPEKTFRDNADGGLFDYAEWRNNDVGFGEEPRLVWNSGQGSLGSQRRGDAGADTRGGRPDSVVQGEDEAEGRGATAPRGGRGREVGGTRFSLAEVDPELERARQQAEYWKQLALKNSDVKDVDKLTRDLMRGYGSRASRSEMSGRMRELEEFLRSGGSEAEARATARQMAEDMLNKAALPEDAADSEYHAAFRRYFRTNSISVPEEVKQGWPDGWGRFRKRYFGRLNLKNDGMDVTKIYREASQQWPDLLPSDEVVMRAQDQLETIAEVLDNLEPNLVNPYGSGPEFDAAVDSLAEDIISSLTRTEAPKATSREEARRERIDRSIDELESREEQQQRFIDDPAELIAASRAAKQKQQQAQKIMRTLRLNQQESKLVDSLLSGALTVDQLPDGIDRRGVLQAYRAKVAVREAQAPVDEYNARRRDKLDQDAADLTEHSDEWKDRKSRFGYDRETARRNFQDIAGAAAGAMIDTYVQPIREHEAEKTRMVSRYNERIKMLKLDTKTRHGNKVSEAYAVQYVGEAEFIRDWLEQMPEGAERGGVTYREAMTMLDEFWRENPNLDKDRIHAAVAEFRSVYDELFAMINEARVVNGYAPIDYRKGYFPHFTSDSADNIIQSLANGLGFGVEVTELPTDIAGTTHLFRPGIQWSGHMLQRTGNETDYNALEGWDRYIPAVANIIYHTEDIQRLRALERTLRHKYSDKTVQDEIERTRNSRELTETQKNSILDELFKRDVTHLNYFVQWLREYTNQLAGKRADLDRVAEAEAGRKLYRIVQKFENRVAANMLGGNISSAMTNFVPLFQAWGNVSAGSMIRAMWDTTAGAVKHDGFRDSSDFLVNRKGYDPIYQTLFDKTKNGLFMPFNIVDDFVSETIVRARYYDELKRGHSPAVALMEADTFAGGVMADRAVGELPVIFNSKNPFVKVFTMFQVEVNNDLSHLFKDVPRDVKERGIKAVFWAILKYVLGVHIFNDLFEALFGRRVSFDPLEMLNNLVGDATGYELPNGFELSAELIRTGQWPGWEAFENGKGDDFFGDLLGKDGDLVSWLENLPFLGTLLGGGRYPILSALPEQEQFSAGLQAFADLIKKGDEQGNSNAYDLQKMYKAARAPLAYFLPPAFGGQMRKIAEGLYAWSHGGSYTITTEGDKRLQYPIEGAADLIRAMTFGKTATRAGKKWVRSDFDTLSIEQTEAYIDLVINGESDSQKIYDILHDLKGDDRDAVTKAYALASADLTDSERVRLLDALVSESQSEKFTAMMTDGHLTFRQCAEVYEEYKALSKKGELKDADDGYVYKKAVLATEFADWIDGAGYTEEQKEVITEQYKFWNMVPAEAGNYEKLTAAGVSRDNAVDLVSDWAELIPEAEKDSVTTNQKIGAVAAAGYLSENEKHAAVRSLLKDEVRQDGGSRQTDYDKYVKGYGISVEVFCQYLKVTTGVKGVDRDGDGETDSGSKRDALFAAIDTLPLQPGQKTALALYNGSYGESSIRKNAPWLR